MSSQSTVECALGASPQLQAAHCKWQPDMAQQHIGWHLRDTLHCTAQKHIWVPQQNLHICAAGKGCLGSGGKRSMRFPCCQEQGTACDSSRPHMHGQQSPPAGKRSGYSCGAASLTGRCTTTTARLAMTARAAASRSSWAMRRPAISSRRGSSGAKGSRSQGRAAAGQHATP